ncbi:arrestin domain-containing protein [Loa loa]|uniref:Arrestin domain-containing protein n=2 Tax=Loa loa TaxID=7209 RepID=A0A1I7VNE5_LOALO|nr:arrestin domain-containing protein [Loa loa]EFO25433.1 arrestin domain-containing protein [Loa loa]
MPSADDVFRQFEIELDAGSEPIFHGDELITGKLQIELKRPMTIQAIKLQFKGRAACIKRDSAKGAEIEKVYFDRDFTLLERPPGRPEPGHFPWIADYLYCLPFECPLPLGCPTSYENPHGFIRYFIRATVVEEAGTDSREYIAKKPISVIAPVESFMELVAQPIGASETVSFGGCCCRGKLIAEVRLPKSAYAPGETVIGSIRIDNRHPRHIVDQMELRLVDRVQCVDSKNNNTLPNRTLIIRRLEKHDAVKSKSLLEKDEVFFLQIPALAPTIGTKLNKSSVTNNATTTDADFTMTPDQPVPNSTSLLVKFQESPSSATLRFRKKPFLRVEYAIQLSLGDYLLLELPITILPLPCRGSNIRYQPFVGGAQPIPESDESGKFIYGDGFMFTPQYSVLVPSTNNYSSKSNVIANSGAATTITNASQSNGNTENNIKR